jgi:hypothetical protein
VVETLTYDIRHEDLVEPSGAAGAAAVRHRKADFWEEVGVVPREATWIWRS